MPQLKEAPTFREVSGLEAGERRFRAGSPRSSCSWRRLPASTYARCQPEKDEKTGGIGGQSSHTRLTLLASMRRENAAIEGNARFSRSSRPGSRQHNSGEFEQLNLRVLDRPIPRTPVGE